MGETERLRFEEAGTVGARLEGGVVGSDSEEDEDGVDVLELSGI